MKATLALVGLAPLGLILLLAAPAALAAERPMLVEPPPGQRDRGLVWVPVVVRTTSPDALSPRPPYVPSGAGEARGAVGLGPERAAAFWLDRLDVLRVTRTGGDGAASLRAARIVGGDGATAVIDETWSLEPLDDRHWFVVQGPTGGDVWRLTADAPMTVRVERLARRPARVIWETARRDLLRRAGGGLDPLPAVAGASAMVRTLDLALAMADRVGAPDDADDPVAGAMRLFTAASAHGAWSGEVAEIAFDSDVWALEDLLSHRPEVALALPEETAGGFARWATFAAGESEALRFDAGGALRVEARALEPGVSAPVVRLLVDGEERVRLRPASVQATLDAARGGAFPDRQPLVTRDGRPAGVKDSALWSLPRAPLDARLVVEGGPALVRLTYGRLRPLLDEALAGPVDLAARLAAADALIGDRDDAAAHRARVLVRGAIDPGSACEADVDDDLIAAWAAVRCLAVRSDDRSFERLPAALDAAQSIDAAMTWALRLIAAERAQEAGRSDASALLPEGGAAAPDDLAMEVAWRRPRPPVNAAGAAAARAEDAWRRAPTDRDARARVIRSWAHTVWSAVRPGSDTEPPRRWLTVGLDPRPDEDDLARLIPLTAGQAASVDIAAPPAGLGRSSRLRLVAARPGGGPFELSVGKRRFRVEAGAPVEELAFAAVPGAHRVRVHDGPEGLVVWLQGTPDGGPAETTARVEWAWAVTGPEGPIRFDLPLDVVRQRLRLVVRGLGVERARLEVRADVGPARAVDLRFDGPDPKALPLDDRPAPSAPVEAIVDLPPTTASVTLHSPDGARLLVRPTLRTPAIVEPGLPDGGEAATPAADGSTATPMDVVTATSTVLAHHPKKWSARLQRAHALLDLDLTHLARPDIDRLRFDAPPDMSGRIDALLARYAAARDPEVLPMAVPAGRAVEPLDALLVPAEVPPDAAHPKLARQGRADRARGAWLAAAMSHLLLYREIGTVAAAREALIDLRSALRASARTAPGEQPTPESGGLAALSFGALARMDDEAQITGISGIRGPASARSAWLTIEAMEAAAGYEVLRLPSISPFVPPSMQARTAMLAAPWPAADGYHLTPGRGASIALRLNRPATLAAEVWCVPDPVGRPCRLRIRDGVGPPQTRRVPSGQKTSIPLGDRRGRVAIDVVLRRGGTEEAGLRFVADRPIADETRLGGGGMHVIPPYRQRRVFRALHRRPVTITAEGPGALRVEGWRPVTSTAEAISVRITGPDGVERIESVPLDPGEAWARGEGRRPLWVSQTRRRVFTLLADGAHTVRIEPDAGEALMRLAVRVDRDGEARDAPPPMTWRLVPFDPTGLPFPLAPPEAEDARPPGRWGTLSVVASWLQTVDDDPTEETDESGEGRTPAIAEFAAIGRRRFDDVGIARRMYGKLSPALRLDLDSRLVGGGRGGLRLYGLGPGLGLGLDGEGWAGEDGWSARGRLTLWRGFRLSPDWRLTPSARLWWGRFADDPGSGQAIDPVLGTDWRRDHARGWRLGGSLRWQMLRAQHLRARLDAFSNDDFASLDRVDPALSWTALFGLNPVSTLKAYVGYRPSWRFEDEHRREGGLSHQLSVGLDAGFWLDRETRLILGGRFRPFIDLGGDLSPRFVLSLGLDFTSRALLDFDPIEEPYPDLAGRRFWLPPREVDR